MTRFEWKRHWNEVKADGHDAQNCPLCQARAKTIKANMLAKLIRGVYADLGMKRVKGNLGGIYYE